MKDFRKIKCDDVGAFRWDPARAENTAAERRAGGAWGFYKRAWRP
jgi:hypothetical protein